MTEQLNDINLRNIISPPKAGADNWLWECFARAEQEIFALVHELTPEIAEELMRRNDGNRPISADKLSGYTEDIANGSWKLNGESIIISQCGNLNDGQHRCMAVINANKTIQTVFVFGVKRETRTTVDQGKIRRNGERLHMEGVINANQVASIVGLLWQYDRYGLISKQPGRKPTYAQLNAKTAECCDLAQEAISVVGRSAGVSALGKVTLLAFCHCVFARIHKTQADEFIYRLVDGVGLAADSPIYICRQRVLGMRKATTGERAQVIFKGWIAYINNKRISKIQLSSSDTLSTQKLPRVR